MLSDMLFDKYTNNISESKGLLGAGAVGRDGVLQRFMKRNDWIVVRVDAATEEHIRQKNGLCAVAKAGEPGELLWRVWDPEKIPGYYKDQASTQKKTIRDVKEKGDYWFRSGDLLRCTSDGFWYFIDRLGDTFRWRSENVSTMVSATF